MERLCLRRLTTQKGASRMVVQSSELKSPLDFTIWNPRIPSIYARGPERAEITSFSLALNSFGPASRTAPFRAPAYLETPRVVVLTEGTSIGGP